MTSISTTLPLHIKPEPIPTPSRIPFIGNGHHFLKVPFPDALTKLGRSHGPFFELKFPGERLLVATGYDVVEELCDERRFTKKVGGPLKFVRRFTGDGLLTAMNDEENWALAHQILMPAFSMKAIRGYFPMMLELSQQLVSKWQSTGAQGVDISDDFTRLTLDTIALCGFGARFNSFQSESLHPFVDAMLRSLADCRKQMRKSRLVLYFDFRSKRQFTADRNLMFQLVDDLIQARKNDPKPGERDLMGLMLEGVDRKSGRGLSLENIRYQLITFLIAGHETTSGWLSFAMYFLMKHPDVMAKALAEVDAVLGDDPQKVPEFSDIQKFTYIDQVLKETLRLWPTAPGFSRVPKQPTLLAGKYQVGHHDRILVVSGLLHRDPKIWGPKAEEFDPENFSPEACKSRPEKAYRPFGTGMRICIGQHFATVEATLALVMILRHFKFDDYGNYKLKVQENLTIKPTGFKLKVKRRDDLSR